MRSGRDEPHRIAGRGPALTFLVIAVVLGVVEGLTEFLPVSSTGHLIVAGHLLGYTGEKADAFLIFIQLGPIVAVMWETRATLARFARSLGIGGTGRKAAFNLALAFFPFAIAGFALHNWIERELFSPRVVGWGLILGAAGILLVERLAPRPRVDDVGDVPWRGALGVGLAQCLSLFPGASRSAATIMGGMALGLARRTATEFSFLVAIPTMLAATLYSLFKARHILVPADLPMFALGLMTAFVVGLAAVRFLLRWIATHDFRAFAWYRIAAGVVIWLIGGWLA